MFADRVFAGLAHCNGHRPVMDGDFGAPAAPFFLSFTTCLSGLVCITTGFGGLLIPEHAAPFLPGYAGWAARVESINGDLKCIRRMD